MSTSEKSTTPPGGDDEERGEERGEAPSGRGARVDLLRDKPAAIARFQQLFCGFVPHNSALGLRIVDLDHDSVEIVLPYAAHLVGDPESGVLHGGAVTSLIDATCGASVFLRIMTPIPIATLDLRIDYLRSAEPGMDVLAHARCYHVTRNVAFVRGLAYNIDRDRPIASASATFMLQAHGKTLLPDDIRGERRGRGIDAGEGRGEEGR